MVSPNPPVFPGAAEAPTVSGYSPPETDQLDQDIGNNITILRKKHPDWKEARVLAAALKGARKAGNTRVKAPSSITPRKKKSKKATGLGPRKRLPKEYTLGNSR